MRIQERESKSRKIEAQVQAARQRALYRYMYPHGMRQL